MMWRRKQEKKVKEIKKGDCNKIEKKDQVKRFKNKCCISPEKTETQSDGNLILFTAEQIRGPQQQVLYSSSTHKKEERKKNFLCN
jgi:hypothetical protein